MAGELNCARSTVQAAIKNLVEFGYMEVRMVTTPHEAGERDSAHEYRVRLDNDDYTPADLQGTPAGISAPPADPGPAPINDPCLTTTQRARETTVIPVNLSQRLCDAAGIDDETKSVGLLVLSEPLNWLENGCDLEKDILPTIMARRKVGIRSWAYFSQAVFEAKAKRTAGQPAQSIHGKFAAEPKPVDSETRMAYLKRGVWLPEWGPKPELAE